MFYVVILAALWGTWMVKAAQLDGKLTDLCYFDMELEDDCSEINFYDVNFLDYPTKYSDMKEAVNLMDDLGYSCDDVECIVDYYKDGCRWSTIYVFFFTITLLFTFNSAVLISGAYHARFRMIGNCCFGIINCLNLAAIIVTGVFRFNTMGQLAAISTAKSFKINNH